MDAACWVSWGEGIKIPYSTGSSWRSLSIALLSFILLSFLFIDLCRLLLLVFLDADPVLFVLNLHMNYSGGGPSTYVYCIVCLSCDSSPICKKCFVFAHHYTLDDDSECSTYYELSLLPKVFPRVSWATSTFTLQQEFLLIIYSNSGSDFNMSCSKDML